MSTVFLATVIINEEPPRLWETMIFGGLHGGEIKRYTSREQAQVSHDDTVEVLRAEMLTEKIRASEEEN